MPFAFLNKCCNLEFRHPLCLKVLEAFESAKIGYGTTPKAVMAMTNRFVKISADPERLEIRRYEYADGGINMERVHKYWVERTDQATR